MKTPPSISKDLVARVEDKLIETYLEAQSIWNRVFDLPLLEFDLVGRCAGRAYGRENRISLNPVLLLQNQADFIVQTVPHEIAHLLTHTIFRGQGRIRPHGPEWKSVMHALGLRPIRCHNYDTTNARMRSLSPGRQERRFSYACACRIVQEPTRTHLRLQRGEIWSRCTFCGSLFTFHGEGQSQP